MKRDLTGWKVTVDWVKSRGHTLGHKTRPVYTVQVRIEGAGSVDKNPPE